MEIAKRSAQRVYAHLILSMVEGRLDGLVVWCVGIGGRRADCGYVVVKGAGEDTMVML